MSFVCAAVGLLKRRGPKQCSSIRQRAAVQERAPPPSRVCLGFCSWPLQGGAEAHGAQTTCPCSPQALRCMHRSPATCRMHDAAIGTVGLWRGGRSMQWPPVAQQTLLRRWRRARRGAQRRGLAGNFNLPERCPYVRAPDTCTFYIPNTARSHRAHTFLHSQQIERAAC